MSGAATAGKDSPGDGAAVIVEHEMVAGAAPAAAETPPAPCCSDFLRPAAGNSLPEAPALAGVWPLSRADVFATHFARLQAD